MTDDHNKDIEYKEILKELQEQSSAPGCRCRPIERPELGVALIGGEDDCPWHDFGQGGVHEIEVGTRDDAARKEQVMSEKIMSFHEWAMRRHVVTGPNEELRSHVIRRGGEMSNLKRTLMERDGLTSDEADELIEELTKEIDEGDDPEELLFNIGLEPDYIEDLIG